MAKEVQIEAIRTQKPSIAQEALHFFRFLKNNPALILVTLFFTLLAYGLKLMYYSISIDTEIALTEYTGNMNWSVGLGRFMLKFFKNIYDIGYTNPYVGSFFLICTVMLLGLFWAYMMHTFSGTETKCSRILWFFPAVFVCYPTLAEMFNFTFMGFETALAMLTCGMAAYLSSKWAICRTGLSYGIVSIVLLVWSLGSYQATLPLYLAGCFACYILYFHHNQLNKGFYKTFFLRHIVAFGSGTALYYILSGILRAIFYPYGTSYLENQIAWGQTPVQTILHNIREYIKLILQHPVWGTMFYVAVAIFLVANGIYVLTKKRKAGILYFLATGALCLSPFFLCIALGSGGALRTQMTLSFVLAFGFYFCLLILKPCKKKVLRYASIVVIIAFGWVALQKGQVCAQLFYSDYMRYQQDVALAGKISARIEALDVGERPEYPVVLIGNHTPFQAPAQITGEVMGWSFFDWGTDSQRRALAFMNTLGYVYRQPSAEQSEYAARYAKSMQPWPSQESVAFTGEVIVVRLS